MRKILFLGVLLLGVSVRAEDPVTLWKDTGLTFEAVEEKLTSRVCYASLRKFHACINALTAFLATKRLGIFPEGRRAQNPMAGKVAAEFGKATITELVALKGTRAEAFAKFKQERAADLAAWKKIFEDGRPRVRFASIAAEIRSKYLVEGAEAAQSAQALNGFMAVDRDPHTYLVPTKLVDRRYGTADLLSLFFGEQANLEKYMLSDRDRDTKMGYLKIRMFNNEKLVAQLKSAIEVQTEAGAQGFILDLRDNSGGRVDVALNIIALFAPKGATIARTRRHYHAEDPEVGLSLLDVGAPLPLWNLLLTQKDGQSFVAKKDPLTRLPLVVLINEKSASVSELVAGSLQNMSEGNFPVAIVVGVRSYGKGTMQAGLPWGKPGITLMKTVAYMEREAGAFQLTGIDPDLKVFSKPQPSDDDKFAVREEDRYWTALPARGEPYKSKHADAIKKIVRCATDDGLAKTRWRAATFSRADYQLLSAQDALHCRLK